MRESLFESHALAGRRVLTSEHLSQGAVVRAPGGTLLVHPVTWVRLEHPRDPVAQLEGAKAWHQAQAAKRFESAADRLHRDGVSDRLTIAHARLGRHQFRPLASYEDYDAIVRDFAHTSAVRLLAERLRP